MRATILFLLVALATGCGGSGEVCRALECKIACDKAVVCLLTNVPATTDARVLELRGQCRDLCEAEPCLDGERTDCEYLSAYGL